MHKAAISTSETGPKIIQIVNTKYCSDFDASSVWTLPF